MLFRSSIPEFAQFTDIGVEGKTDLPCPEQGGWRKGDMGCREVSQEAAPESGSFRVGAPL